MKYIWEEEDIICGRFICCESYPEDSDDISGLCSVTYKLGFIGGSSQCMCEIAITDGLVLMHKATDDRNAIQVLMDSLNNDKSGYRPLTKKQLMRRMDYIHSTR